MLTLMLLCIVSSTEFGVELKVCTFEYFIPPPIALHINRRGHAVK